MRKNEYQDAQVKDSQEGEKKGLCQGFSIQGPLNPRSPKQNPHETLKPRKVLIEAHKIPSAQDAMPCARRYAGGLQKAVWPRGMRRRDSRKGRPCALGVSGQRVFASLGFRGLGFRGLGVQGLGLRVRVSKAANPKPRSTKSETPKTRVRFLKDRMPTYGCKVLEINTTGMYQYFVGNAQYMTTYESRQTLVQLLHLAYNPFPRATPLVHKSLVGNVVFEYGNIFLTTGNTGFLRLTYTYIVSAQPCSNSTT